MVELSRMWSSVFLRVCQLDRREQALEVVDHALLDAGALEHPPEDEQHQESEREYGQEEVVRHHRGQPGDVLLVGATPEGGQVAPAPSQVVGAANPEPRHGGVAGSGRVPLTGAGGFRTASTARLRSLTPRVAASAATVIPAQARSSTPGASPAPRRLRLRRGGWRRGGAADGPVRGSVALRSPAAAPAAALGGAPAARSGPRRSARRGLRTPGLVLGSLPNSPPSSERRRRSGSAQRCLLGASRRIPPRAQDGSSALPVTLGGRRCCRRGSVHRALGCRAGIREWWYFSPRGEKPLDFRKYSDYDSNGRLNVLRMGMETHVRPHRGSFPGPLFPRYRVRATPAGRRTRGNQAAARYNKTESDTSLKP